MSFTLSRRRVVAAAMGLATSVAVVSPAVPSMATSPGSSAGTAVVPAAFAWPSYVKLGHVCDPNGLGGTVMRFTITAAYGPITKGSTYWITTGQVAAPLAAVSDSPSLAVRPYDDLRVTLEATEDIPAGQTIKVTPANYVVPQRGINSVYVTGYSPGRGFYGVYWDATYWGQGYDTCR